MITCRYNQKALTGTINCDGNAQYCAHDFRALCGAIFQILKDNSMYKHLLRTLRYSQYCQVRQTSAAAPRMEKPVEMSIKKKLTEALQPAVLDVINESNMHNVPKGSETHFKVVVVTEKFENLPLIKRHRLVNETLKDELQTGVHALSIIAKTPKQWEDSGGAVSKSPPCQGGAKR